MTITGVRGEGMASAVRDRTVRTAAKMVLLETAKRMEGRVTGTAVQVRVNESSESLYKIEVENELNHQH